MSRQTSLTHKSASTRALRHFFSTYQFFNNFTGYVWLYKRALSKMFRSPAGKCYWEKFEEFAVFFMLLLGRAPTDTTRHTCDCEAGLETVSAMSDDEQQVWRLTCVGNQRWDTCTTPHKFKFSLNGHPLNMTCLSLQGWEGGRKKESPCQRVQRSVIHWRGDVWGSGQRESTRINQWLVKTEWLCMEK